MIGFNDVISEIFIVVNVDMVMVYVVNVGLVGVYFWLLDCDMLCVGGSIGYVLLVCNLIDGIILLEYI